MSTFHFEVGRISGLYQQKIATIEQQIRNRLKCNDKDISVFELVDERGHEIEDMVADVIWLVEYTEFVRKLNKALEKSQ